MGAKHSKQVAVTANNTMDAEMKANYLGTLSDILSTKQLEQIIPILTKIQTKARGGASAFSLVNDGSALLDIIKQE